MKATFHNFQSPALPVCRLAAAVLLSSAILLTLTASETSEFAGKPTIFKNAAHEASGSARFRAFIQFIFKWEGEYYENDPDDSGGETKFGIDRRSHPGINIRTLTKAQALAIYWEEWKHAGCESMPSPFSEIYFNCAVNMGLARAKQFAAISTDPRVFLDLQEDYYRRLARSGPKRAKYLNGWLNRTAALRKWCGL